MKANNVVSLMGVVASALTMAACYKVNVSQNESAIKTVNGVITEDNLQQGGHWFFMSINSVHVPKISHTTQNATITVLDNQQCGNNDCIPVLQTNNSLTVTGSLTAQWNVEREQPGERSVMADLYTKRAATDVEDVKDKLLMPAFRDCVISSVRKRSSYEVNNQGDAIKSEVQACLQAAVTPFHIVISHVYDNGFGPSPEARTAMARVSFAKLGQDVAQAEIDSAEKRKEAAVINAGVYGTEYQHYKAAGVPDQQIPEVMCLKDPNSASRSCVRGTAMFPVLASH